MDVVISKAGLRPLLFGSLTVVAGAGVLVEVLRHPYELSTKSGVVPLLSLSYEENVPTFYTAVLLLACAALLSVVALGAKRGGERFVKHWWMLAAGFTYIAFDEVLQFHEHAGKLIKGSGLFYFSWVIPASILVLVIGLAYIPFLRHLPRPVRSRFVLAGAIYVGGAVGMDLPLGWWTERHGEDTLGYALIDATEESLEMLGLILFLLALVGYLADKGHAVRFAIAREPKSEPLQEQAPGSESESEPAASSGS
jgi:hypothetical protein